MGRKLSVQKLSQNILDELQSRYLEKPYLTIDDHHQWLIEQGFSGSRHAVWRYLKTLDDTDRAEVLPFNKLAKLICLEVAKKYTNNENDLLELSKKLLSWIDEAD